MSKKKIQLSDHFDYSRLIRFVLPCIGTMLFTAIYGIVDGLCVSNFVGKTAFAAVNLIMPVPMLVGTVGFMLGTGGSAIVGITLGEGSELMREVLGDHIHSFLVNAKRAEWSEYLGTVSEWETERYLHVL